MKKKKARKGVYSVSAISIFFSIFVHERKSESLLLNYPHRKYHFSFFSPSSVGESRREGELCSISHTSTSSSSSLIFFLSLSSYFPLFSSASQITSARARAGGGELKSPSGMPSHSVSSFPLIVSSLLK
jgi:hypothetical protein